MIIHLHTLLRTSILKPYRELAEFGLTTESTQKDVLTIDKKASFQLKDRGLLAKVREPNQRLRMDFFCFSFADKRESGKRFDKSSTLDPYADKWLTALREAPHDAILLHRLAVFYHSRAWEAMGNDHFEGMFAALQRAVPFWAMLLEQTEYLQRWRNARFEVYKGEAGKNIVLMFAEELVSELAKTVNGEIKNILQQPAVLRFSRLRSNNVMHALEREQHDLQILSKIGGLENKAGVKIVCGTLGVRLFKLQIITSARAKELEKLHASEQDSYMLNIKKDATADEKLEFRDVQNFRLAFFELGEAFFKLRSGNAIQGLAELSHLAGVDKLENAVELIVPRGSLFYSEDEEGRMRFEQDFWRLASDMCKETISGEILKESLNFDQVRSETKKIVISMQHNPFQEDFFPQLEDLFLSRLQALLQDEEQDEVIRFQQAIRLAEIFMAEAPDVTNEAKIAAALAKAAGNLAAVLANQKRWELSLKYYNRCLAISPGEFVRIREAAYVYGELIRQTKNAAERISFYIQILSLLNRCAPHHEGNKEFEKLHKSVEVDYRIAKGQGKKILQDIKF